MTGIVELSGDIWQIDLEDCGQPGRTAGYLVKGTDGWMLIETGPASSVEKILEAAKVLGIKPAALKYITVTHIHIDHAGGLGLIAQHFNQANIVVHHKGAKHIINPSRLIEGTTAVWGEEKMKEFGPIMPVPEGRIIPAREGQNIDLGSRIIEIWETPGHAKHHVCYYDDKTKGLFSGDAAGIYQPRLSEILKRPVMRPSTPVPDFNGEQMLKSLMRMARSDIKSIYFTHFGPASPAQLLIELIIGQLSVQLELAMELLEKPNSQKMLSRAMLRQMENRYKTETLNFHDKIIKGEWEFMSSLIDTSAAGILHYLQKNKKIPASSS